MHRPLPFNRSKAKFMAVTAPRRNRATRITEQKTRLSGFDLTGPFECSYASYDVCLELLEKDAVYYLAPHHFSTRTSEVSKEKPGKELVIDANSLKISDKKSQENIAISNELELSQAFTRRALACDVVGFVSCQNMEKWHRYLFYQMALHPPPGYSESSLEQILRADRAGWIRLAEKVPSVKRTNAGDLPLDAAFDALQTDAAINFKLLPLPQGKTSKPDKVIKDPKIKKVKGKGKGKMPKDLIGMSPNTSGGDRICYNFNLKHGCKYAKPGQSCKRGRHVCMKCHGNHSQISCKKADDAEE